jgi:hypothetical protein
LTVGAPSNTVSVSYVLDGQEIGTMNASPWSLWWTLAVGEHELVAVATLADGTEQTSAPLPFRVVVSEPPQTYDVSP